MQGIYVHVVARGTKPIKVVVHVFAADGPVFRHAVIVAHTDDPAGIAAIDTVKNRTRTVEAGIGNAGGAVEKPLSDLIPGHQFQAGDFIERGCIAAGRIGDLEVRPVVLEFRTHVPAVADVPQITCRETADHAVFVEIIGG